MRKYALTFSVIMVASLLLAGVGHVNALSADYNLSISGTDPQGDVKGLLGDPVDYTSPDILEASVSMAQTKDAVNVYVKMAGPIPISDENYWIIVNLKENSILGASIHYSNNSVEIGLDVLDPSHFSIGLSSLSVSVPLSYFDGVDSITEVEIAAYLDTENDTYTDTMYMYASTDDGSGGDDSGTGDDVGTGDDGGSGVDDGTGDDAGNDAGDDSGSEESSASTPGFSAIGVLAALSISMAAIYLRKRSS